MKDNRHEPFCTCYTVEGMFITDFGCELHESKQFCILCGETHQPSFECRKQKVKTVQ